MTNKPRLNHRVWTKPLEGNPATINQKSLTANGNRQWRNRLQTSRPRIVFLHRALKTCFYINERWCTDVTVLKKMCCSGLEMLFINYKPFYSPREICSFILMSVYIPPHANARSAIQKLTDKITETEQKPPDTVLILLGDFNKANLSHELPKYRNTDSTSHVPPETVIYWITVKQR